MHKNIKYVQHRTGNFCSPILYCLCRDYRFIVPKGQKTAQKKLQRMDLSELVEFNVRENLNELHTTCRESGLEGLMLKPWSSSYVAVDLSQDGLSGNVILS